MTQLKLRAEDMEFAHIEYACDAGLVATEPDDFVQTWMDRQGIH